MQIQTLMLIRNSSLTVEEANTLPKSFQAVMGAHPVIARADIVLAAKEVVQLAVQAGRVVLDAEVVFHERKAPDTGSLISLDAYAYNLANHIPNTAQNAGVAVNSLIMDAEVVRETGSSIRSVSSHPADSQRKTHGTSTGHALAVPQRSIFDRMEDTVVADEARPPRMQFWWDFVQHGQTDIALSMLEEMPQLSHEDQVHAREFLTSEDPEHIVFVCFAARKFVWKAWVLNLRKLFAHTDARVRVAAVSAVGELAGPSLAPSVYPLLSDPDANVRRAADVAYRKLDR